MHTSTTTYSENNYIVGTLIIDVYDAKGKKMIWESIGKGTVAESKTPEAKKKNIAIAVQKNNGYLPCRNHYGVRKVV